jgi:membrane protease YdiL (CAAX protease family)
VSDKEETTGVGTDRSIENKKPGIAQVSILFSITIILFLFIGYRVQHSEFYSGVLISEFGLIMLPAFIFLLLFRYDLRSVLRLKGTKPINFLITFVLMAFAIPLAGVFNLLNLIIVNSIFGKIIVEQMPVADDVWSLLVNILVIAGSAGLCEEFLFRGVIQRGFERRFGTTKAILLAAFLFSLTHMDFQKIFGTFVLGALIGFIVYRTDSLFSGMFAHFTNNALAVLLSFIATKLMSVFGGSGAKIAQETDLNGIISTFSSLPLQQLAIVLFFYGFLFLIFVSFFILLLVALIKLNPVNRPNEEVTGISANSGAFGAKAKSLAWLLPGILLIACLYYFEVLKFQGVSNGLVEVARRLLGS